MKMTKTTVLPRSGGEVLDRSGVNDSGYIDKKGTPSGEGAMFNKLPPGEDITAQEVADIPEVPYKQLIDKSYPGDGWTK